MAAIPATGPAASMTNAHRHPIAAATGGTSWIDIIVRRNPTDV
jgi:hypothetical protein